MCQWTLQNLGGTKILIKMIFAFEILTLAANLWQIIWIKKLLATRDWLTMSSALIITDFMMREKKSLNCEISMMLERTDTTRGRCGVDLWTQGFLWLWLVQKEDFPMMQSWKHLLTFPTCRLLCKTNGLVYGVHAMHTCLYKSRPICIM